MKVLHLVFHPDLSKSKVNRAWAEMAKAAKFTVKEMYQLYPDFKIDLEQEQSDLLAHDRIVFQFPFYWYSVPPLMKKWMDDVLAFGFAYGPPQSLKLAGKDFLPCVSVGGPTDAYVPGGYNNFSVPELLRPLQQSAFLCRMNYCTPFWMHGAVVADSKTIAEYGERMIAHINNPSLSDVWSAQKRIFKAMGIN